MRLVERADESEVVLSWLAGELGSERFAAQVRAALGELGAGERLVGAPDLGDRDENRLRYEVLKTFRGDYLGDSLDGLAWSRVALRPEEVLASGTSTGATGSSSAAARAGPPTARPPGAPAARRCAPGRRALR